ncbi:MAG: prepilin peptidase [Firmicutes bacterium HGW-Firmicutes-1]|jgi:leader peptidase (prepilin peptidase)/N-methyltransferase|nr:MAG: prepilin peptidase [Firmicutes bacterium HGW-Firmicutes-1]
MIIINFLFIGILIGSFLNVCIYRIPKKQDIIYTPSHCFNCSHKLAWYDLVPVFTYLVLRGKCRYCQAKISIQYPIIELSNGAAYMGIFAIYGLSKETIIYSALFSILLVIAMIDYKHYIIPNGMVITLAVLAIVNTVFNIQNWLNYLIGFLIASIILLIIAVVTQGKMGGGDIKLMAVAGLLLGWQKILLALMLGSVVGAVIGLTLIALKIIKREQMIPFGPFLTFGIMVSALFGQEIISWYLSFIL